MRKYKIREGSIADYGRIVLTAAVFWAVLLFVTVNAYPA